VPRDRFGTLGGLGSAEYIVAITPNDGTDLDEYSRAVYVGGAGDLTVMTVDNTVVTFFAVPAGAMLPIRVRRVRSTSTTATNILVLA
jgi:hypothetical protein